MLTYRYVLLDIKQTLLSILRTFRQKQNTKMFFSTFRILDELILLLDTTTNSTFSKEIVVADCQCQRQHVVGIQKHNGDDYIWGNFFGKNKKCNDMLSQFLAAQYRGKVF